MNKKPVALLLLAFCGTALRADVIVNTSLIMTSLQIAPGVGTLQLSLAPGVFGDVYDTLGDYNSAFDYSDDPALASASIPLANINDSASVAGGLGVSASSGVSIFGIAAEAGTDTGNNATISGTYDILDPSGAQAAPQPVDVTFTALLNASQTLFTDPLGISAFSEVTFALDLPDLGDSGDDFLYFVNPETIGPDSSDSASSTPTLSETASLLTNTTYIFFLEADAESNGINSTPEPVSLMLIAGALAGHGARRLLRG